jgi:hypothetical protein
MFQSKEALPAAGSTCASTPSVLALLFVFIVATRWPLAPRYLYYFDSANFAFSLEHFNPALHQPQPPGYPLYVLLIRAIHLFVQPAEKVLLISGLLAAFAAIALILFLARDLFDQAAGVFAAVLLASDPAFWFGGITNEIRIFLAAGALGVGLLAWRALTRPAETHWLYAAYGALGIAAGFRPELGPLLLPLLVWVWWASGRSLRGLAVAATALAATTLPWLAAVVWIAGGPREFLHICTDYADDQFGGSSLLFGASGGAAWHMFAACAIWTFLGALVWLWAAPVRARRIFRANPRAALFLVLGFVPVFVFSGVVHIGDPDQALASVAFVSILGGGVLAALRPQWSARDLYIAAALAIAAHAITFFRPPGQLARASSYKAVAAVDRFTRGAIDSVRSLAPSGPLTIVHYGSPVASRQLSYYFPDAYVVVLPSPGHSADEGVEVFHRHATFASPAGTRVELPGGPNMLVCVRATTPRNPAIWAKAGPIYYRKWAGCRPVTIGEYTLICSPTVTTVSASTSSD